MVTFLNKVSFINEIRFMPWFLNMKDNVTDKIKQHANFSAAWNQKYVDYKNFILDSDPNRIYFVNSISDVVTVTLLQNIIFYFGIKVLHLLFYLLRNKHKIFKIIYLKIMHDTKWWTLIISTIEVNMISLAFDCAVQLTMPSFFCM